MEDRFMAVDSFIRKQKEKENGFSIEQCCRMFGVSRSGYYAWKARIEDKDGKQAARKAADDYVKELMRLVIAKLGFVPGKRTFHIHLWRDHGEHVSVKRCRRLMKEMNLTASRPKKDAYKHQATHDHECASPVNAVNQNFYIGPRTVILTDITYLYYGPNRTVFYLCAFKDAFTKEILGSSCSTKMNVGLVTAAYENMMKEHGQQLKKPDVYIHSDQGIQYLSTTFKKILEDDGFIQSVSGRGNSQDNSPMESFFSRMKTAILSLVALCPTFEKASELTERYINSYNTEQYQYNLAGLTPHEYYLYATTGIYPLDNYYGMKASELQTIEELVKKRREYAEKKAEKVREKARERNKERNLLGRHPLVIVDRDRKILEKEKKKWSGIKETAENQISHLSGLLDKVTKAAGFIRSCTYEVIESLRKPQNWQLYPELDYIYGMKELF